MKKQKGQEFPSFLTVAHKKKGIRPEAMSCEIASLSDSGGRAYFEDELVFSILQFSG